MPDSKYLKNISRGIQTSSSQISHAGDRERHSKLSLGNSAPLHFCPHRLPDAAHSGFPRSPADTAKLSPLEAAGMGEATLQGFCH